jgi:acetolactate synthase-1/2/3 large subunit
MNVSEYIAGRLKEKLDHVFGFQGGAILKLVDSFVAAGLEYVQTYHEQAAALAADAYARITGGLGVAIATSGPGVTNLLTGIANAYYDSIPVIFFTGQDYTNHINKNNAARQNGFQEVDAAAICRPVTKYAKTIMKPEEVPYELGLAINTALTGRPGPVLLDIPIDIQFQDIDPEQLPSFEPPPEKKADVAREASIVQSRLFSAKRPVVLAGGGLRLAKALAEFEEFINLTGFPVVTTLNALDVCLGHHSFSGLYGNTPANLVVNNADLVLVLGSRLGLRQVGKRVDDYTRGAVIQVDIDVNERNRGLDSALFVHCALKDFLRTMNVALRDAKPSFELDEWRKTIDRWERQYARNNQVNHEGLDPVRFVARLCPLCRETAIFTADVGQNQMWVAQGFRPKGRQRLLNSSGHGAMGFSLPAAIGAVFAAPSAQTVAFTGDGGLQMNIRELMSLAHRRLNIKCLVFKNNTLGMMREVQARYFESRFHGAWEKDFACPDLELLAKAYGLDYDRVTDESQISELAERLKYPGPALIEVPIALNSQLLNRYDEVHIFEREAIRD